MSTGRWRSSGVQKSNGTSTCAPRAPRRCAIFRRSWPAASNPAARDGTFTRAWRPRRPSSSPLRSHPSFVPGPARPLVALDDVGGPLRVDERRHRQRVGRVDREHRSRSSVRRSSADITVPSVLSDLAGTRGTLLGDSDAVAFRVLAPIGHDGARRSPDAAVDAVGGIPGSYTVTVQDQTTGVASSSPPLQATEWMVAPPLARGHQYTWQVAATAGRTETVAPRPPDPPAQFAVLDAATVASLGRLPASHLARGILCRASGRS